MCCKRSNSVTPEIFDRLYKRPKSSLLPEIITGSGERSNFCRSAEIIGGNDDLLMKLFVFLPAIILIRFQSVCKQWQSVIFSIYFSHYHNHHHIRGLRHQSQPSFILRSSSKFFYFNPTTKIILPFRFNSVYTRILQSSHGLLLLECRNTLYGRKQYYVYNPTTRRFRNLFIESMNLSGLCLAFDPSKSPYYKVVSVRLIEKPRPYINNILDYIYRFSVYDSSNHTWKGLGELFTVGFQVNFCNGIYLNNRIYWMRHSVKSFYLDLETGKLGKLPKIETPWTKRGERNKNYVMESNGHLYCVSIYLGPMRKSLLVYEMSGNFGWFKKYFVNLRQISGAFDEVHCQANVLGITRGENNKESSVWIHVPGKIIWYRFYDEEFEVLELRTKEMYIKGDRSLEFETKNSCKFIESLASV